MALGSRRIFIIAAATLLVLGLAYLRDPPWLIDVTSGLSAWESDGRGVRYRWTRGHASFFVPAHAAAVGLTLRSVKDAPSDWPITARISVDDQQVQTITLADDDWRDVTLRLPRAGDRAHRRVDVVLDRVRARQRGLQLQAVRIVR